jgi:hypothetical protein
MRAIIGTLMFYFIFAGFTMSCNHQQYHPSKGEQLVNSILGKTAKIIRDKYNLKPSGSGAAMFGGPIQELALSFATKSPLTKEQLRELIIKTANELLNQVNDSKEIQEFIKNPPFTIKNVEIIIFNQDKECREVYDPQIATAQIIEGVLTFSTVDPQDHFNYKNNFTETYEDALKIVQKTASVAL